MDEETRAYLDQHFGQLDQHLAQFAEKLAQRSDQIDQRFDQIDQRFDQIDQRFAQIDKRFTQIDQRFAQIDKRFTQIEQRFAQVDQRFVDLEIKLTKRMDDFAASLEEQIRDSQTEVLRAVLGYTEALQARVVPLETQSSSVTTRLGILEQKMREFEARYGLHPRNPPPQQ